MKTGMAPGQSAQATDPGGLMRLDFRLQLFDDSGQRKGVY